MNKFLAISTAALLTLTACKDNPNQNSGNNGSSSTTTTAPSGEWDSWPVAMDVEGSAENNLARNFILVFDHSGSMNERSCSGDFRNKGEAAHWAVKSWLNTVPAETNLGLVLFNDQDNLQDTAEEQVKLLVQMGSGQNDEVYRQIKAHRVDGGTPLSTAIDVAHNELMRQANLQGGYGEYNIVVVTDGEANSGFDPRSVVNSIVDNPNNPVQVHTVGFCLGDGHSLNQPGRVNYVSADNPDALASALENVTAESNTFTTPTGVNENTTW